MVFAIGFCFIPFFVCFFVLLLWGVLLLQLINTIKNTLACLWRLLKSSKVFFLRGRSTASKPAQQDQGAALPTHTSNKVRLTRGQKKKPPVAKKKPKAKMKHKKKALRKRY